MVIGKVRQRIRCQQVMVVDTITSKGTVAICCVGNSSLENWSVCYRFPSFKVFVVIIVFGECVVVFQSKTLRHESNVHPLNISYDRYKICP